MKILKKLTKHPNWVHSRSTKIKGHNYEPDTIVTTRVVVVDQFTPGYQFRPALNFLEDL